MALLWLIAWNKGLQTRHLELRPDINKYEDRPEQDWKMVRVTSWFSKTRSHSQLLLPLRQLQITRQHWYLRLNWQWVQLTISLHSQEVNSYMLCTLIFICTIRNDYKTLKRVEDDCKLQLQFKSSQTNSLILDWSLLDWILKLPLAIYCQSNYGGEQEQSHKRKKIWMLSYQMLLIFCCNTGCPWSVTTRSHR